MHHSLGDSKSKLVEAQGSREISLRAYLVGLDIEECNGSLVQYIFTGISPFCLQLLVNIKSSTKYATALQLPFGDRLL
jgi:hypothetical protein